METVFNRYSTEFSSDFTLAFNVKNPKIKSSISLDLLDFEAKTGVFTNKYAKKCFNEIKGAIKSKRWEVIDWSFAGRSNGWFVLLCNGNSEAITDKQESKIESIIKRYFDNYGFELEKFY